MYELQSTLAAYARRKFSSGEISVDHLKNILKVSIIRDILNCMIHIKNSLWSIFLYSKTHLNLQEVRKYLKECIQIFSFEPTCIQEGRLAAIARLDLVELETFVDSVEKTSSVAAAEGMASLSWRTWTAITTVLLWNDLEMVIFRIYRIFYDFNTRKVWDKPNSWCSYHSKPDRKSNEWEIVEMNSQRMNLTSIYHNQ